MPSDKNNGFNDMQTDEDDIESGKSFPDSYLSKRNQEDQQALDEATTRRNSHLNDFFNKALDPPRLDPNSGKDIIIPPSEMPKFPEGEQPTVAPNKLSSLKKYMPSMEQEEDVIPYDPNSGTLMNIGRFALNNLATDKFSGGMPVAGSVKAIGKLAQGVAHETPALMAKAAAPVTSGTKNALEKLLQHFSNPSNVKTMDDMLTKKSVMETYFKQFPEEAAAKFGQALGNKPQVIEKATASRAPYEFMDKEGARAIQTPMIENLMKGKSAAELRNVPAARKAMNEAGELAESGMSGTDLMRTKATENNGRAMYMADRDAAALAAKRKAAIANAAKKGK